MQTVIEQHLQAPVGLFLVFLQTLKASIGLANFRYQCSASSAWTCTKK